MRGILIGIRKGEATLRRRPLKLREGSYFLPAWQRLALQFFLVLVQKLLFRVFVDKADLAPGIFRKPKERAISVRVSVFPPKATACVWSLFATLCGPIAKQSFCGAITLPPPRAMDRTSGNGKLSGMPPILEVLVLRMGKPLEM